MTGMVAGIMLVISCSDDSPGNADAATCDCPAAEPPLDGRLQVVKATAEVPANSNGGQGAQCPVGSQYLGGGCGAINGQLPDIVLRQSAPSTSGRGWYCEFRNNEPTPVTIEASVFCLVPAS